MYPTEARINDIDYPINTDYKVALQCLEISEDDTICDEERSLAIIYLLFGFIPEDDLDLFLDRAIKFLQCGETIEQQKSKKKDMDFQQDEKYIVASFMSDYHIDLSKEDMHWWQFINLIQGLTKDSVLSNVREIRGYDLSKINDPKEQEEFAEIQNRLALKVKKSKKQIEAEALFDSLMKVGE